MRGVRGCNPARIAFRNKRLHGKRLPEGNLFYPTRPVSLEINSYLCEYFKFPVMAGSKILYVCQEITPYLPPTEISSECRLLVQAMQERGNETRTFMPRYGVINERRNQLHEVIRLSGMNLIIDDNDHQLIIKVASIPSARVQIYFIDNDDYFARKAVLRDPATDGMFPDNDERAIFFARGVLETVRKLRWEPTVVHCHGWFSAVMPIYLRNTFADDPMFQNLKIAVSIYDDAFPGTLDAGFRKKIENEGIKDPKLALLDSPSYENLMKLVIDYADGVVMRTEHPSPLITAALEGTGKVLLPWQPSDATDYLDNYQKFYEELLQ